MATIIYPRGFNSFVRNPKAPDFVVGNVVINVRQFQEWVAEHPELLSEYKGEKQLKLNVLRAKDEDKLNFTVDTWKPEPKS